MKLNMVHLYVTTTNTITITIIVCTALPFCICKTDVGSEVKRGSNSNKSLKQVSGGIFPRSCRVRQIILAGL